MKNLTTIGRILFAIPFALFGINHFLMLDYYLGMLTSFVPLGPYTIILTGIMLILASISIITKILLKFSTLMLSGLLFVFIITIHIPHLISDVDKTATIIALLKDISLMGGSLMISGIYSEETDTVRKPEVAKESE
jgi:putative oxidoreductase